MGDFFVADDVGRHQIHRIADRADQRLVRLAIHRRGGDARRQRPLAVRPAPPAALRLAARRELARRPSAAPFDLSQDRAETIRAYLASRGVAVSMIATGRGSEQPLVARTYSIRFTNTSESVLLRKVYPFCSRASFSTR